MCIWLQQQNQEKFDQDYNYNNKYCDFNQNYNHKKKKKRRKEEEKKKETNLQNNSDALNMFIVPEASAFLQHNQ